MKDIKLFLLGLLSALFCITACSDDDGDDKSSAKELKSFQITNLDPVVNGVINQAAKTVSVTVPYGTNVTALRVSLIISDLATVSPASETVCDFTGAVPFKVTAEDGSSETYVVTVKTSLNGNGEGGEGNEQQKVLRGTMSENTTLKELGLDIDYVIEGGFYVEGNACLTIEPGVTIAFTGDGGFISVGEDAGLKMAGTEEKPIKFTGPINNQNKGSWGYIEYNSKRSDNKMSYVTFENGGSRDAVLYITDAKVSIDNCTINGSLRDGIVVSNSSEITSFSNNTIKNCDGVPFSAGNLTAFKNIKDGNSYLSNGENVLKITNSTWIGDMMGKKFTMKPQSIPYHFDGFIIVGDASELIVEPGTSILMKAGDYIEVNGNSVLTIEGTEDKPINITSTSNKEYFRGIWVGSEATASIKNVNISMTKENAAITIDGYYSDLTLENVTIKNSRDYGVYFQNERNENLIFSQSNVTFENCAKGNVYHAMDEVALDDFAASYPVPEVAGE